MPQVVVFVVSRIVLFWNVLPYVQGSSNEIWQSHCCRIYDTIGIGMHNFGEGLAIGAAVGLGSVAFGAFLVVGFALHNTTEGIAIAAPLSQGKTPILLLAALGALAGTPAIFGAWIGGFAYSPFTSVIFLAIGAGAIFQVIVVLMGWIGSSGTRTMLGRVIKNTCKRPGSVRKQRSW